MLIIIIMREEDEGWEEEDDIREEEDEAKRNWLGSEIPFGIYKIKVRGTFVWNLDSKSKYHGAAQTLMEVMF